MSDAFTPANLSLADRLRAIASNIRQENEIQAHATARILGAAAAIAQNQDHLIDEVVDMVTEDLEQREQLALPSPYTAESLQQQFSSLKAAKDHFNLKARSWATLAEKLNASAATAQPTPSKTTTAPSIEARLAAIDANLDRLNQDMAQVLNLLAVLIERSPR